MLGAISNQEAGNLSFVLKSPTDNCAVAPVLEVAVITVALFVTVRDVMVKVTTSGKLNTVATSF